MVVIVVRIVRIVRIVSNTNNKRTIAVAGFRAFESRSGFSVHIALAFGVLVSGVQGRDQKH